MKYTKQNVVLLAIAVVWGSMYLIAKRFGGEAVLSFLILRFAFAGLALFPLAAYQRRWPTRDELVWGLKAGVVLGAAYVCMTSALRYSDSGQVGVISALTIVIVPLLDFVLTRRMIRPQTGIGISLGLIGLKLLSVPSGATSAGGLTLAFLGALFFAVHYLVVERFPAGVNVAVITLVQMACVVALCMVLQAAGWDSPSIQVTSDMTTVVLAALICGVIGTALGFSGQVWAQRSLPSYRVAFLLSLESPFAVLLGILGHESLHLTLLLGCVVMFAGVWLVLSGAEHKQAVSPAQSVPEAL